MTAELFGLLTCLGFLTLAGVFAIIGVMKKKAACSDETLDEAEGWTGFAVAFAIVAVFGLSLLFLQTITHLPSVFDKPKQMEKER